MSLTPGKLQSITGKTQANGAQTFTLEPFYNVHQIQFTPSATPVVAGTMVFAIRTPGAASAHTLDFTVALTDSTQYVVQIHANGDQLIATPSAFDAAKTYALALYSSRP